VNSDLFIRDERLSIRLLLQVRLIQRIEHTEFPNSIIRREGCDEGGCGGGRGGGEGSENQTETEGEEYCRAGMRSRPDAKTRSRVRRPSPTFAIRVNVTPVQLVSAHASGECGGEQHVRPEASLSSAQPAGRTGRGLGGSEDADGDGGAALNRSISLSNERAGGGTCENLWLNFCSYCAAGRSLDVCRSNCRRSGAGQRASNCSISRSEGGPEDKEIEGK
jgi:hypothetical protein